MRLATGKDVKPKKNVVFCIPTITKPYAVMLQSLKRSIPHLEAAGWTHHMVNEIGNPYISAARNAMLRKALDAKAEVIVFLDHDLSWKPKDLLTLIETEGDYVCGTYRFKHDEVEYMGRLWVSANGHPIGREQDGAIKAYSAPAGFMKITRQMVHHFIATYPELCYGDKTAPTVDLFNHGAKDGLWWGEDYACCRNWHDAGGEVWIVPNLDITHHTDKEKYPGNYHKYLLSRPGGKNAGKPPTKGDIQWQS